MNIINIIKEKINQSSFLKNLLTLLTGSVIAQALPILFSPILTRIYTPEDFGLLAVFMSLTSIFGTIANARYEMAVLLPKKETEAINIVSLGTIISTSLSIFLLVFLLFFHDNALVWLKDDRLSTWLYFIPLVVFLIGLFNMLNYYNTRIKAYKEIAKAKVYKSVAMNLIQLIIGILKPGAAGLIAGYGSANFFGNLKLLKNTIKDKELLRTINKKNIINVARKYKRFPIFTFPATLANNLAVELISVLTSTVFTIATLGFYSLANRILAVPGALIGTSVGQVYMQEAASERNRLGNSKSTFISVVKKLIIVGLPSFAILFFISEELFAFVFGEEWRIAGAYAKILIPLLFIKFITVPVSVTLSVFEKQHISLFWQLGLLALSMLSIGLAYYYKMDFTQFLYIFVSVLSAYYIYFIFLLYKIAQGNEKK